MALLAPGVAAGLEPAPRAGLRSVAGGDSPARPGGVEESWLRRLGDQLDEPRLRALLEASRAEPRAEVYPPAHQRFAAFELTPFERVRVVILGQDPYPGPGQANGLCFSVSAGQPLPGSLQNIFTELRDDLGVAVSRHGDLSHWARQGVLLLNSVLSVERGKPGSHRGMGWEPLTDRAVSCLNDERDGLVFALWGQDARRKGSIIDESRHFVLSAAHPSPRSAHAGFFGCRHFSRANDTLRRTARRPVDWRLPD